LVLHEIFTLESSILYQDKLIEKQLIVVRNPENYQSAKIIQFENLYINSKYLLGNGSDICGR